jgi:hypothetical protein
LKRDLRSYARQTNVRLAVGALLLLFGVGLVLIYFIYGGGAALVGLLCLLGSVIPIGLIFLVIQGLDWFMKHARPQ